MRRPSLQRRLIIQPLILNIVLLALFFVTAAVLSLKITAGSKYSDGNITAKVARIIVRGSDGHLTFDIDQRFAAMAAETPSLWFIAVDRRGDHISYGDIPPRFRPLMPYLYRMSFGEWRDTVPPYRLAANLQVEDSRAGPVAILAHGPPASMSTLIFVASNLVLIPLFVLLALVAVMLIPWIVRRSFAPLSQMAIAAEGIGVESRQARLPEAGVPSEIVPFIHAVNGALRRLEEAYLRQRRFIADAAHELRTPIAILRARVEASHGSDVTALASDVARLANLTEQLLDLQRMDHDPPMDRVDLAALSQGVAADLAPLLISAKRDVEVIVEEPGVVRANVGAIERVLTNLVQNAVEHGGRKATIRVIGRVIEVEDDGPGIPAAERGRVFEPFYRLRPRSYGTGLGLNLVQEVMERHNGRVSILDAPAGGTIMRLEFPRTD